MTVHHTTAASELAGLARHVRGRVILPGDGDWDSARRPWNRRVDQRPVAVVEPEDAGDMSAVAAFAGRHELRVSAESTGHGAGADLADTILLRTGRMREIVLDTGGQRALIGAGARWGDLMTAVSPHGLAASAGSTPGVGVAGYAMFGGVGMLGRTLGFAADHIAAADVVTADGSRIRCDAADHPDLWWALRGGGGGFALLTRLELRLARPTALYGGQIVWPAAAAPDIIPAWRSWTASVPPEMTSSVAVVELPLLPEIPDPLRGRRITSVTACYAGPAADGENLLRPLARAVRPLLDFCRPLVPAELATLAGVPAAPRSARIRCELLASLPDAAVSAFLEHGAGRHAPLIAAEIRHLGGAYAGPRSEAGDFGEGAIARVAAPYLVEFVGPAGTVEADAAVRGWQGRASSALAPWTTGRVLPSFADPAVSADTARAFPPETLRRLADVKRRYDPGNVLRASFLP